MFDNVSKRHVFVKNVFKNSKLDKDIYYFPAEIPGRKLEQFIFSIKKNEKPIRVLIKDLFQRKWTMTGEIRSKLTYIEQVKF